MTKHYLKILLLTTSVLFFAANALAVECGVYRGGESKPLKNLRFESYQSPSKPVERLSYSTSDISVHISYNHEKSAIFVVWLNLKSKSEVSTLGGFNENGIFSSGHSTGNIIKYEEELIFSGDQDFRVMCTK